MPKDTIYITGTPGLTYVSHPMLAYSEVMMVSREGRLLVETSGTPTGNRFKHNAAGAKVELPADQPIFGGDPSNDLVQPETFVIEIRY